MNNKFGRREAEKRMFAGYCIGCPIRVMENPWKMSKRGTTSILAGCI